MWTGRKDQVQICLWSWSWSFLSDHCGELILIWTFWTLHNSDFTIEISKIETPKLVGRVEPLHTVVSLPYSIHFGKKFNVKSQSKVLNLRYINVCQYHKYYLKYWSQAIFGPLDPPGGQNFQCFIKWDGLTGRWGVYWRVQNNDF